MVPRSVMAQQKEVDKKSWYNLSCGCAFNPKTPCMSFANTVQYFKSSAKKFISTRPEYTNGRGDRGEVLKRHVMYFKSCQVHTGWGGRLWKRFCNMFCESSTGSWAELQLPCCPSKHGELRKNMLQNLLINLPPQTVDQLM